MEGGECAVDCDRLIVACGGLAGTKLGGSMAGYKLLAKFGHRSTKLRPTLVQLKSGWPGIASLKGVRANCYVEILKDGQLHSKSTGEIQFTDYGLSQLGDIILGYLSSFGIYKLFNNILVKYGMTSGTSYEFYVSVPALLVCILVSVICGFVSSYIPYSISKRRREREAAEQLSAENRG